MPRQTHVPIATTAELGDATSWVNTSYSIPQAEYDAFYKAIGEALATWAMVESKLSGLLHLSLGSSEIHAVDAVFASQEGFRGKLKMVDQAIRKTKCVTPDIEKWAQLHDKLRNLSMKRNDLAHHIVFYDHHGVAGRKLFQARQNDPVSRRYQIEIETLSENFSSIGDEVDQCWANLAETKKPQKPGEA